MNLQLERLTMIQIEFVKDKSTKETFDPKLGVGLGVHKKGQSSFRQFLGDSKYLTIIRLGRPVQHFTLCRLRNC